MPSMPSMSESPPSLELSVVIPVWNGEHSLGKLLPRLNSVLASVVGPASEVVVALPKDDPVGELVEREGGRIANFDFPGFGHALNAGLSAARGRWVVTMDADFSHHPEFIRTLWLRRNEAELLDLLARGLARPHVGATFRGRDAAAALRYVADGHAIGKVVLDIGGGM